MIQLGKHRYKHDKCSAGRSIPRRAQRRGKWLRTGNSEKASCRKWHWSFESRDESAFSEAVVRELWFRQSKSRRWGTQGACGGPQVFVCGWSTGARWWKGLYFIRVSLDCLILETVESIKGFGEEFAIRREFSHRNRQFETPRHSLLASCTLHQRKMCHTYRCSLMKPEFMLGTSQAK